MYGYVRPDKSELLVREFARFRSFYCGVCKNISARYGQICRLTVSYDLTFLALFLQSISDADADTVLETCILGPAKKKPIAKNTEIMNFVADMSILFAYYAAKDHRQDEHKIKGFWMSLLLRRAGKKIGRRYSEISKIVDTNFAALRAAERAEPTEAAASFFANILAEIFARGGALTSVSEPGVLEAVRLAGFKLGHWIFVVDAIDDWEKDRHNGEWNLFSGYAYAEAKRKADEILKADEVDLDRIFALLPYERDGAIVHNIVVKGLPLVRKAVLSNCKLPPL